MKKNDSKKSEINRNEVAIEGKVKEVYYSSDKCQCFSLEVQNEKGRLWLKVKEFKPKNIVEENDKIGCLGYLTTESSEYKGKKKYETVLVATEISN